ARPAPASALHSGLRFAQVVQTCLSSILGWLVTSCRYVSLSSFAGVFPLHRRGTCDQGRTTIDSVTFAADAARQSPVHRRVSAREPWRRPTPGWRIRPDRPMEAEW